MKKVEEYLIKYGFIYPTNSIYGRLQNLWDYGHLGAILKENIKNEWYSFFVTKNKKTYFMDCSIFSDKKVWDASGHIKNFHDFLIDCKKCKKRFRNDELKENLCPFCGSEKLTDEKSFNLMFKANDYYLRPETAQSIFINFKNILDTMGSKLSFSVAQIGKSFRNEITINKNIFKTREFEQMELEFFTFPENSDAQFTHLLNQMQKFLFENIGIKKENIQICKISKEERAHYSKKSYDLFFKFEDGFKELWGLSNRGDFDLLSHQKHSKTNLEYFDPKTQKKILPHVVEHSIGLNRLLLAVITNSLCEEKEENGGIRVVLKINKSLAPYKFSVLPLTKNEISKSEEIHDLFISENISTSWEEKGSIGKRYRKQDAIGTPYCITVDQNSINNNLSNCEVTIRDRDTKKQKKINIKKLISSIQKNEFDFWQI